MLLSSLDGKHSDVPEYYAVASRSGTRWVFTGAASGQQIDYESWPKLSDVLTTHYSGLNENRLNAFITIDRAEIEKRMKAYFDKGLSLQELAERVPGVDAKVAGYDPAKTRKAMLAESQFDSRRIMPLSYRPFDDWWVYGEGRFKLFNRPRPDFLEQVWPSNVFISASQTARKGGFNQPIIVDKFGDLHLQDPWSQFFPLWVRVTEELGGERIEPNVDHKTLEEVCVACGIKPFEKDDHTWSKRALEVAECIFYHTLAVLWSPAYRRENEAALRQDWPRVPIPADAEMLDASAKLGRSVADLLLPDKSVPGVTTGKLRPDLRALGIPCKVGGGNIDPTTDLVVDAGWGFRGQKNAVMCGKGKVVPSAADPNNAVDIYINNHVYWANVPNDAWAMTIGGYPVIKKWLSYREHKVHGRPLRLEELTYITEVIRRLKALLLLGEELDANYRAAGSKSLVVTSLECS